MRLTAIGLLATAGILAVLNLVSSTPWLMVREPELEPEQDFLSTILESEADVPDQVDWRKIPGRVGAVPNQKFCEGAWAFVATGLLEGQMVARNISKTLQPLSAQQLIDCSVLNYGCDYGSPTAALTDVANNIGGLESEQDYGQFTGQAGTCHVDNSKALIRNKGQQVLARHDEEAMKKVVATYGPVAATIFLTQTFLKYSGGVIDDPKWKETMAMQDVLIVGYGSDAKLGDYWIVRNSWGADWGEFGYARIKRGVNMLGVTERALIATF